MIAGGHRTGVVGHRSSGRPHALPDDVCPGGTAQLLSESENAVFRVDTAGPGTRCGSTGRATTTGTAIESELAWVAALRADGVVRTPAAVRARDGST